jgi:DNA invertase Pin-like site-specific DNA recombinase
MRAAIYARVSSLGQREKHTIESQLRVLPAFVAAQGWILVATFVDDGKSARTGKLEARDGFAELLRAAERREFDVVVVVDVDRLTRTDSIEERAAILGPFQRANIQIVTPAGGVLDLRTFLGEMYVTMQALFAAEENRKRAERTRQGKLEGARRGRKVTGVNPYGILWDRDAKEWKVDEAAVPIVHEVARRILDGESCHAIAMDLDRRGVPRARGMWTRQRVWDLVSSRHIVGEAVVDRKNRLIARVPAILAEDVWQAMQHALAGRKRAALRRTKRFYLLEALGRCGTCDEPMHIRGSSPTGRHRARYICRSMSLGRKCGGPSFEIVDADRRVWAAVCAKLADPQLEALITAETENRARDAHDWERDAQGFRDHIARLDRVEEKLLERFRRGAIGEAAMDAELAALGRERNAVRAQLATAERAVLVQVGAKQRLRSAVALVERIRARLANAEPEMRREIVRTLIDPGGVVFVPDGDIHVVMLIPTFADAAPVTAERRFAGHDSRLTIRVVA